MSNWEIWQLSNSKTTRSGFSIAQFPNYSITQFQNGGLLGNTDRSRHLHPRIGARSVCRISRCEVWRPAADRALRACGDHAAGCTSSAAALAVDAAGGSLCSRRAMRRISPADGKTLSGTNLRIVPGIPHWNRRRLRRVRGAARNGGIVEVKLSALQPLCHPERSLFFARSAKNNKSKDPYSRIGRLQVSFLGHVQKT